MASPAYSSAGRWTAVDTGRVLRNPQAWCRGRPDSFGQPQSRGPDGDFGIKYNTANGAGTGKGDRGDLRQTLDIANYRSTGGEDIPTRCGGQPQARKDAGRGHRPGEPTTPS